MSLALASDGVLIKGLSSLCLPGSSSLTRSPGHQSGGTAQRGQRRAIAFQTRAGGDPLGRREGVETGDRQTGVRADQGVGGVQFADLFKYRRHELFP